MSATIFSSRDFLNLVWRSLAGQSNARGAVSHRPVRAPAARTESDVEAGGPTANHPMPPRQDRAHTRIDSLPTLQIAGYREQSRGDRSIASRAHFTPWMLPSHRATSSCQAASER
jgi:hypothetical protein